MPVTHWSFRGIAKIMLPIMLSCAVGHAYDYSEPMRCKQVLPLGYPESPFVLRFSSEELKAQPIWSRQADAIVIANNASDAIRTGAEALRSTLTKLGLGDATVVEVDSAQAALPATFKGKRVIVLGVPGQFALANALAQEAGLQVTVELLNEDGFIIKPISQERRKLLLIVSPVARGVLYGAYELEERTSSRGMPRIDQTFIPSVRYRGWPTHVFIGEPADALGRWRLNISMASDWGGGSINPLLFYKDFPELGGAAQSAQILTNQQGLHARYANSIKNGAMPAITWNPLSFSIAPQMGSLQAYHDALSAAHPGMAAKPDPRGFLVNFCPSNPATRLYVESAVREFVETFPEIELINIMLSDLGGELNCGCEKCAAYPFLDRAADYMALVIKTARQVKPSIRFTMCPPGLLHYISAHHPEFHNDPVAVAQALKNRLGPDVEAFLLSLGSPPGGDCQSWLAPDCMLLDKGVPLISFFQHYESDGPGIVSPISCILSHLSWSLPMHLNTLQRCAPKGMVGVMIQGAGIEVGCWHPELDGNAYMQNWCRAKYGKEAGQDVFLAIKDTHKITEAFYLDTKPDAIESVDFYRWGTFCAPWATDMGALKNAGLSEYEVSILMSFITLSFSLPQAPQPDGLRKVTVGDQEPWLERFAVADAIAIADQSEQMLAKALASEPGNSEIQLLHELAKATQSLVRLFKEYHLALLYANTARNTTEQGAREEQVAQARQHFKAALEQVVDYRDRYLPLVRNQDATLWSLKFNAPIKYMGTIFGILREAAYLFDQEFGGESLLSYMDQRIRTESKDL